MEPAAIVLLLIVLVFIMLFVARPFLEQRHLHTAENNHELSFLLAEHERLLTALQELDFDQSLGKIPAEDFPTQRAAILQKGADVLRQLDALGSNTARRTDGKAQRGNKASKPAVSLSDDDLEDLIAKRRNTLKVKTAGFCTKCGKPVLQSDVFCPSCGNTLK